MNKKLELLILLLLVLFLFIIPFSYSVFYDVTELNDLRQHVDTPPSCSGTIYPTAGSTVQNPTCNYTGQSITDDLKVLTLYFYNAGGYETAYFNITLNETVSDGYNYLQFGASYDDKESPLFLNVTVYDSVTTNSQYLGQWNNSDTTCNATVHAEHKYYNFSLDETIIDFDRVIVKAVPKVCQFGGFNTIRFSEFTLLEVILSINELPFFNVSISDTIPCLNSTRGELELNITIDSFDAEGDTILYSLRADENNAFVLADFTGTVTPLNIEICSLNQIILDTTPSFTNFLRLLLDIQSIGCTSTQFSGVGPLSNVLPSFSDFDSCDIDSSVSSNFYITEQVNTRGDTIPMLYLNPFCDERREAFLKTDVGIRNLTFASNLVINELLNNSFNITFYDNPLIEEGKTIQLFFNLSDNNTMEVFNYQGNGIGLLSILNFSMDNDDNKRGFYRYLGVQLNYDFSNDIYNITFKTLNSSYYYASNILGYWNNTGSGATPLIKYIGIGINQNTSLGDIYIENYYYGGFTLTVSPFYSTDKPTSVPVRRIGDNTLNFYVTDNVHQGTSFVTESIGINVFECGSPYALGLGSDEYISLLQGGSVIYNGLCSSFGTIFTIFGDTTINMCNIMYFIYLIVCLIISLVLAFFMIRTFLNPALTFGISGLVFSLSQLLLYQIFLYSQGLIILYSMILGFSAISLFASLFTPKSSVGG